MGPKRALKGMGPNVGYFFFSDVVANMRRWGVCYSTWVGTSGAVMGVAPHGFLMGSDGFRMGS